MCGSSSRPDRNFGPPASNFQAWDWQADSKLLLVRLPFGRPEGNSWSSGAGCRLDLFKLSLLCGSRGVAGLALTEFLLSTSNVYKKRSGEAWVCKGKA